MPNILIRNVPEETKRRLEQRAAENGRSQNAEAVAILEEALAPAEKSWLEMLMDVSQKYGVVELELPEPPPPAEGHSQVTTSRAPR